MRKLFIGKVPTLSIRWRTIDLRRWYYVWIGGELMRWWAMEYELEDIRKQYKNEFEVKFKRIPIWKTILR